MKILIITGGTVQRDFASVFLEKIKFDKVICADHGLTALDRMRAWRPEIAPDVILGDFDSVNKKLLEYYKNRPGTEFIKFDPEKDYTDTRLALEKALSYVTGDDDCICLLGATGTRLDHTMANVHLLELAYEKCHNTFIQDAYNRIYLIKGEHKFIKKNMFGDYISLIPLNGNMALSISGFKYDLVNRTVENHEGLCISNELLEDEGIINVYKDMAIVFETRDKAE